MHRRQRQHEILTLLQRQRFATVGELGDHLGASEATVRRDLAELAKQGAVRRLHGGVEHQNARQGTLSGQALGVSQTQHVAEKRAIGRAAAGLCRRGDSLTINGGSTTAMMAQFLPRASLQVLTNALPIADYLIRHTENRILIPSGEIFREQNIVLSPFAGDSMNYFHADRVFLGAQSIGPHGMMESDTILIRAVHTLMRQSKQVVALMDSSKFAATGNLVLCSLKALDTVVTDSGVSDEHRTMLDKAGIELIIGEINAEPEPAEPAPDTARQDASMYATSSARDGTR